MMEQEVILPFDVTLPPVRELRAGSLLCFYEMGNLRSIRIDDVEILRMIYAAVRDQHWATAPCQITNEYVETTDTSFSITYTAHYELDSIRYKAGFEITGTADNTITVSMHGEAFSDFKRNRIGLCVLHPVPECAGVEVQIRKPDGDSYKAPFPKDINPHQPFLDIAQMHYSVGNVEVILQFEGDIFETEDQRNWTDSSFKTYSTPLRLPMPVTVKRGETITQRVTLHVTGEAAPAVKENKAERPAQKLPFPKIGFSRLPGSPLLHASAIELLKKLPFHHYRVTLHLHDAGWIDELQRGTTEAQQLGTGLELIVFFSTNAAREAEALIQQIQNRNTQLYSILVLQTGEKATPQALMQTLYPVVKQTFSNAHIGWGTDGNFAELNRNRPAEAPHDFVSFSLYPQVHASDLRTIIENLETQHQTLETARTFTQQPIHVSPLTFAGRQVKTSDARQQTAFVAWWTLKTLQNLSSANSITFYEITGPNGLLQSSNDETERETTPIYEVFAKLSAFAPVWVFEKVGTPAFHEAVIFENCKGERLRFTLADMGF
jgi:D-apionolactonase